MTAERNPYDLFGLDLRQLLGHWRQGWLEALRWPLFARLLPAEPVRLRLPDGSEREWPAAAGRARARALLLPDELVLQQRLQLPLLSAAEQRRALALAVQAASPFAPEATVWGYHAEPAGQGVRVDLALAARPHVADYVTAAGDDGADIEIWTGGEPFVVLEGFAETRRHARNRRRRHQTLVLVGMAGVLLTALVASPALQARQQVREAQARLDALTQAVAPVVATRDAFGRSNLLLQAVAAYGAARPDPVVVLGRLTKLLPDSVYLTRLDLRGDTVTINGLADNAAGLMETLGAQPDLHDVRSPSAIARDRNSGRETFVIEFKLAAVEAR